MVLSAQGVHDVPPEKRPLQMSFGDGTPFSRPGPIFSLLFFFSSGVALGFFSSWGRHSRFLFSCFLLFLSGVEIRGHVSPLSSWWWNVTFWAPEGAFCGPLVCFYKRPKIWTNCRDPCTPIFFWVFSTSAMEIGESGRYRLGKGGGFRKPVYDALGIP